ncbi:MAG TPA: DUF1320 family protein [Thermoanaerobaculia bacterium]|jgi:phage gp36-like protein|nr:MAG: hypothetical protein BWX64_00923 [Acidobacteria bacterium ADurb.Bin051]HNU81942.1 DUF1320 family protein [Thermoanaerobaculia bacterium]
MPTWLTEAELETRYGATRLTALADRDGDGTADAGVIEAAILEAESRVESRLRVRYQPSDLPTTPTAASAALKRVVAQLAFFYLHELHDVRGQDVYDARDGALAELSDMVRGHAGLLLAGEPDRDQSRPQVLTTKTATDARFTLEAMEDW